MSWLDIILVVVAIVAILAGLKLGLFQAVFLALGIYVGMMVAGPLSNGLAGKLADSLKNESTAATIAYIIVLVVIVLVAVIIGSVLQKILHILFLGFLDSLGGLLLGVAAAFLLGFAVVAVMARLAFLVPDRIPGQVGGIESREKIENALVDSALVPAFLKVRNVVPPFAIPDDYEKALDELEARRAKKG